MQISKIYPKTVQQNYNYQPKTDKNSQIEQHEQTQKLPTPNTKQYLAFTGGYSLNLAETITNLDKLAQKYPDIYPKNVREWAGMILEEGNKQKDTLISIHKKLYENIKDCFNLKELKERFPEFKDVKSASELDAREGSLLDDLKKGKLEYFNNEEDLSLQIIKLYWGEGFSLNDLKAYTNGKDINNLMERLNIPKVNRHYGHILKFSDPEYNERLTKQMVQKRMEALDIKAQKADNEPVYIKRGPLSAEHRKHISEGLKKYYQENPERIFSMSERQKQFYQDNPEEADLLHRVMVKAWNIFGADRIKQAMSKFMQGKGFKDFNVEDLDSPFQLSKEKSKVMKQFWANNEWAKKSLSKNMEFAWKKVKEEQEMFYVVDLTPNLFKQRFFAWAEKHGIDTKDLTFDDLTYYPHKPELNTNKASSVSPYTRMYVDSCEGDESQKMANTYQLSLLKFGKELKAIEKSNAPKDTKDVALYLRAFIKDLLFDTKNLTNGVPTIRSFDAQEIQRIYVITLTELMDKHENKLIQKLNQLLNESFNYLDKNWKYGQSLMLPNDASNF